MADGAKEPTVGSYGLSEAMRLGLLWLLNPTGRLGRYPRDHKTWRGLQKRELVTFDFRAGTGGRYLTEEGRRIASLLKDSALKEEA